MTVCGTEYGFDIYYDGAIVTDNGQEWYRTKKTAIEEALQAIAFKMDDYDADDVEYDENLFEYEIIEQMFEREEPIVVDLWY